jgi:TPR repeat protein
MNPFKFLKIAPKKCGSRDYMSGRLGVMNREQSAREWYAKAAARNDPEAMFRLAIMSIRDPQGDKEEAFEYLRRASELGYWLAEGGFGAVQLGEGPHKNIDEGIHWIEKGAKDGDWVAQNMLALILWRGQFGVQQNKAEAIEWFRKSAESGLDDSQAMLGALYLDGNGVPKDVALARRWLSLAAQQGHAGSKDLLKKIGGH